MAWPEDGTLALRDGLRSRLGPTLGAVGLLNLLGLLSLVGPVLVLAAVAGQSRKATLNEAGAQAQRTADLLARHAAGIFDSYDVAFGRLDEHVRRMGAAPEEGPLHAYLAAIDHGMKAVDALFVLDASGVALAHSRYLPVPKVSMNDREYMRDLAAPPRVERLALVQGKGGLFFGAPVYSRYSGQIVLPVSRAFRDEAGRLTGAAVATVSQVSFADLYRTLALAEGDYVALLRADHRVLAQVPPAPGRPAVEPETTGALGAMDRMPPVASQRDAGVRPDVGRHILGLGRIEGYPVSVEVGYDVEAVLAPWRRQTLLNAVLAALAALGLYAITRLALRTVQAETRMQARVLTEANRRADAEAALRQSQKMEAFGQLTGGIAHDFANLLNIVLINLELARKRLSDRPRPDLDRLEIHVDSACQGAERGVALTRRLLAFAHRQPPASGPVQVADLLEGLTELLR